jgi:hypothetical protein
MYISNHQLTKGINMQPLDSYQDIKVPEQDAIDYAIEMETSIFNDTGECLNGEVTHDDIMDLDLLDQLKQLGESAIDGSLSFNDILTFRRAYDSARDDRIKDEIEGLVFENELMRAGL